MELFDSPMENSSTWARFQSNLPNSQINTEIITQMAHLNPHKINSLDKVRNLQSSSPNIDPLGLPQLGSGTSSSSAFTAIVAALTPEETASTQAIVETPVNRSQWKLRDVILGHSGHVTSLCFDPMGQFYASGSSDATIKFWDAQSNTLQLTLTGHIMAIRGMRISQRMPYLFSCSEDKTVKCWDLEKNKVVRDYHGHLSSVYCIELDDEKSQIMTGGRDSSVRVWDVRTREQTMLLSGHKGFVMKVQLVNQGTELISSSLDSTVKKWDLRMPGRCLKTLTYHTKGVRAFVSNEQMLVSGSTNGFKKFTMPNLEYLEDLPYFSGHEAVAGNIIVNTMDINREEGVIFAGCDDGRFAFWHNGELIQEERQTPIPGSLEGENGIACSMFNGSKLFTGNMDKSIRVYER